MNRFLNIISMVCAALSLGSAIWIVVPALSPSIWLYSVAVSEWSLWFAMLALAGTICALGNYYYFQNGFSLAAGAVCVIALLLALYPFLTALRTAREKNVELSFKQYFSGLTNSYAVEGKPQTFVFKPDGDLKLDVYTPPEGVLPNGASVVVVHGGSWSGGGRSDFPQWNEWLAANGYTVFDIDYTLAPQPNYRSAIGDVKCAVGWVRENAAKFNAAPDKIVLLGRSAGAHLALSAAYSANDARLPASCGAGESDRSIRAVVAFYAPVDLVWDYENPSNPFVIDSQKTIGDFIGGSPHESAEIDQRFNLASPSANVTQQTPPTFLIHGGQDQLVKKENLDILAGKLAAQKIPHETLYIPYAQHGFDYNFNGWGAQIAKPLILDFLTENTR
jgi:acetyl esterase/lipase